MRKVLTIILVSFLLIVAYCAFWPEKETKESTIVSDALSELPSMDEIIEELIVEEEPEFSEQVEEEYIEDIEIFEPLEIMAGAIPDEYLENPEEQYEKREPYYTPYDLYHHGVLYWGGYKWTWYSEKVLPGPGLSIPGRWSDGDFVRDIDGCICLASSDLVWGTYVDTPWGLGRVYDSGCASGTLDVYVSW